MGSGTYLPGSFRSRFVPAFALMRFTVWYLPPHFARFCRCYLPFTAGRFVPLPLYDPRSTTTELPFYRASFYHLLPFYLPACIPFTMRPLPAVLPVTAVTAVSFRYHPHPVSLVAYLPPPACRSTVIPFVHYFYVCSVPPVPFGFGLRFAHTCLHRSILPFLGCQAVFVSHLGSFSPLIHRFVVFTFFVLYHCSTTTCVTNVRTFTSPPNVSTYRFIWSISIVHSIHHSIHSGHGFDTFHFIPLILPPIIRTFLLPPPTTSTYCDTGSTTTAYIRDFATYRHLPCYRTVIHFLLLLLPAITFVHSFHILRFHSFHSLLLRSTYIHSFVSRDYSTIHSISTPCSTITDSVYSSPHLFYIPFTVFLPFIRGIYFLLDDFGYLQYTYLRSFSLSLIHCCSLIPFYLDRSIPTVHVSFYHQPPLPFRRFYHILWHRFFIIIQVIPLFLLHSVPFSSFILFCICSWCHTTIPPPLFRLFRSPWNTSVLQVPRSTGHFAVILFLPTFVYVLLRSIYCSFHHFGLFGTLGSILRFYHLHHHHLQVWCTMVHSMKISLTSVDRYISRSPFLPPPFCSIFCLEFLLGVYSYSSDATYDDRYTPPTTIFRFRAVRYHLHFHLFTFFYHYRLSTILCLYICWSCSWNYHRLTVTISLPFYVTYLPITHTWNVTFVMFFTLDCSTVLLHFVHTTVPPFRFLYSTIVEYRYGYHWSPAVGFTTFCNTCC